MSRTRPKSTLSISIRGTLVGKIPNTNGVHGIALADDLGRGFVSDGRDNQVTIFDLKTLATLSTAKTGTNPDGILYDPFSKRVFTFNGRSNDMTAIDAATGNVVGTVPLGGKPEFPATDANGNVYVNIEDKSEIVQFDPKTLPNKKSLVARSAMRFAVRTRDRYQEPPSVSGLREQGYGHRRCG